MRPKKKLERIGRRNTAKEERAKAEKFKDLLIKKTIREGYNLTVGDIQRSWKEIYKDEN